MPIDSNSKLIVQKYGGTSVGSIDRILHVADHIAQTVKNGYSVVAVISAMGDQTDDLLAMARKISPNPPRRELDMLLTAGERISMALVSMALNERGCRAVSLTGSQSGIITDTVHGNARISKISPHRIQENLTQGHVVIVAGFQGVSAETKEITTLGRGGSDLSAIALSAALKASSCELYKDVDGVCSADPRIVSSARLISKIPWRSMTQMAWAGASVLHPRGAHMAEKFAIPVEIRNSFELKRPGTIVKGYKNMEKTEITAISGKSDVAIFSATINKNSAAALANLRDWLWGRGESPQIQVQVQNGDGFQFTWTMSSKFVDDVKSLLANDLVKGSTVSILNCSLISIIGSGFWQSPEIVSRIEAIIKSPMMFNVTNEILTIAVNHESSDSLVAKLHQEFIGPG